MLQYFLFDSHGIRFYLYLSLPIWLCSNPRAYQDHPSIARALINVRFVVTYLHKMKPSLMRHFGGWKSRDASSSWSLIERWPARPPPAPCLNSWRLIKAITGNQLSEGWWIHAPVHNHTTINRKSSWTFHWMDSEITLIQAAGTQDRASCMLWHVHFRAKAAVTVSFRKPCSFSARACARPANGPSELNPKNNPEDAARVNGYSAADLNMYVLFSRGGVVALGHNLWNLISSPLSIHRWLLLLPPVGRLLLWQVLFIINRGDF